MRKFSQRDLTCFKLYLSNLEGKDPYFGGGSVAVLCFCLGVSLIKKACAFSFLSSSRLKFLNAFKKEVFSYIIRDGEVFAKLLSSKGKTKEKFLKESYKITTQIARHSLSVLSFTKKIDFKIKKIIKSDFLMGVSLIKIALQCAYNNLEENSKLFSYRSHYLPYLKRQILKWQ